MSAVLWLWLAYRSFDAVYVMNLVNAGMFLFKGEVSILVPVLTLFTIGLEIYLNILLNVHGINDDNMDDLS